MKCDIPLKDVEEVNTVIGICRNMSGHVLMGRPAARMEMMALVICSYVLVLNVGKRRWLSLYGCDFLIYEIRCPCSLHISLIMNQTLFNVWLHVQTQIIVGVLPKYLILYNMYCCTYGYDKRPSNTIVSMGSSHIYWFNPTKLYPLIRYNMIINNIRLLPNSPKYPLSDHNISK